ILHACLLDKGRDLVRVPDNEDVVCFVVRHYSPFRVFENASIAAAESRALNPSRLNCPLIIWNGARRRRRAPRTFMRGKNSGVRGLVIGLLLPVRILNGRFRVPPPVPVELVLTPGPLALVPHVGLQLAQGDGWRGGEGCV